ncbi:DEKNAAC100282 [Brettanomyces naardenensis]|uniref:DEKNAAC100282 n=1 Tax=Brettanomyces naardenensis TaxID=13370 RepID=A0A448YFD7_BRENA|nr:DEKNAAC100282 [Brettanomyces naardenensis]
MEKSNPVAKVLFRFDGPRDVIVSRGFDITSSKNDESIWTAEKIKVLQGLISKVEQKEGKFQVNYDFTKLSKSLDISKPLIYMKIVELYHQENESAKNGKMPRSEDRDSNIATPKADGQRTSSVISNASNTPISNKSTLRRSLLRNLEQLKLGDRSSSSSMPRDTADLLLRGTNFGNDNSHSDSDNDSGNDGSSDSVINMASASLYLHRSQLLGKKRENRPSFGGRPSPKDQNESDEDYLLASGSLHDSMLEEELLKRI